MSVIVTLNGIDYSIPTDNDSDWGDALSAYLQAIPAAIDAGGGGSPALTLGTSGTTPNAQGASYDSGTGTLTLQAGSSTYKGVVKVTAANGLSITAGAVAMAAATTSTAGALAALDKKTLTSMGIYALTGGGVTADIVAGIAAAQAAGLKHLHFGDGTWTINHGGLTDDSALITIPDGFKITGNGWGRSILLCTNATSGSIAGCATFRGAVNACNVEILDLDFLGENTGPYVSATFNENEAISIHWAGTSTDWNIQGCRFRALEGFAVHDRQGTTNARIHVRNCTGIEIGNSLANVNCNQAHLEGNTIESGEGFECSGKGVSICNNIIRDATGVGITIGGNQNPGDFFPANVIANNTIDGSSGVGITITDGASATVVSNNTIRRCDDGGILLAGAVNEPEGCIIIGNVLESNCADPGTNFTGMDIRSGSRHLIYGNIAVDLGVTGYDQRYGLTLSVPDCVVFGNYFDASNHDASIGTGATNTLEEGNTYANNTLEVISTATLRARSLTAKAAADLVWTTRWNTGSSITERAYFGIAGDGTLWWNDNLQLLTSGPGRVNLYRSAADTLKTDDDFVVGGALSVTGAASASNLSGTNTGDTPVTVKDEGVTKTSALSSLDFVGAGVTATNSGGAVTVTIPGSSGSTLTVKDEGSTLSAAVDTIDFVGGGVTATGTTTVTATIPKAANLALGAVGASPNANASTLSSGTLNLELANASFPGLISAADFTKLGGVASGATAGVTSVGSVGAGNASAASISGTTLTVHVGTATQPGVIAAADQDFGTYVRSMGAVEFQNGVPSAPAAGRARAYAWSRGMTEAYLRYTNNASAGAQPRLGHRRAVWGNANLATGSGTMATVMDLNGVGLGATGTVTQGTIASTNILTQTPRAVTTAAAATPTATNIRQSVLSWWRGNGAGLGGFYVVIRFGFSVISANRCWMVGLGSNTGNYSSATAPSGNTNLIWFGQDTGDTYVQAMHNDSSGTATKNAGTSNVTVPLTSELMEVHLYAPPNGSTVEMYFEKLNGGQSTYYQATTDLPASTLFMNMHLWNCSGAGLGTQVAIDLAHFYIESDF